MQSDFLFFSSYIVMSYLLARNACCLFCNTVSFDRPTCLIWMFQYIFSLRETSISVYPSYAYFGRAVFQMRPQSQGNRNPRHQQQFLYLPCHIDTTHRNYIPNGQFLQNKLLSNHILSLFSPSNHLFFCLGFRVDMVSCIRSDFFMFFLLSSLNPLPTQLFAYVAPYLMLWKPAELEDWNCPYRLMQQSYVSI